MWAVLLGGLVIASLDSGLNLMATDPYYVYVIKGAILVAAIGIDVLGKRWDELPFRRWALEVAPVFRRAFAFVSKRGAARGAQ